MPCRVSCRCGRSAGVEAINKTAGTDCIFSGGDKTAVVPVMPGLPGGDDTPYTLTYHPCALRTSKWAAGRAPEPPAAAIPALASRTRPLLPDRPTARVISWFIETSAAEALTWPGLRPRLVCTAAGFGAGSVSFVATPARAAATTSRVLTAPKRLRHPPR